MKKKLIKMLSFLEDGKGIELGNDTFLVGECDGSDKIYGFFKSDNELFVVSRQCSDGYPIEQMDKEDLSYMFKLSSISKKIEERKYKVVNSEDI